MSAPQQDSGNHTQSITFFGRDDLVIIVVVVALVVSIGAVFVTWSGRSEINEIRAVANQAVDQSVIAEREARLAQERGDRNEVEVKVLRGILETVGIPVPPKE